MVNVETLGLLTALGGSIWASQLGQKLGKAGISFYSLVLLLNLTNKQLAGQLTDAAAYVHGGLVAHMIINDSICPACVIAALGALLAARTNETRLLS